MDEPHKSSKETVIASLRTVRISEDDNSDIYRVAIQDKSMADSWLEEFQRITCTQWIVSKTYPNAQRYVPSKLLPL